MGCPVFALSTETIFAGSVEHKNVFTDFMPTDLFSLRLQFTVRGEGNIVHPFTGKADEVIVQLHVSIVAALRVTGIKALHLSFSAEQL